MTSIDGVSSYSSVTEATTTTGSSELGSDAFMNLLVTQLQYQDPLDPQSNEEFVAQLAQFSSLEQLTNVNDAIGSLYTALASMNNASMTQLLGTDVTAMSDEFHYDGSGEVTLWFDADAETASATVEITDSDGTVVYSGELGALDAGEGSWTWDGTGLDGEQLDEGDYSFSITAEDANGDEVEVTELLKGTVDGMSYETGTPVPSIDGITVDLGDIIEVRAGDDGGEG